MQNVTTYPSSVGVGTHRDDCTAKRSILEDILDLEELDVNLFRGQTPHKSGPRIFGGQTIAQSLVAGYRTVKPELVVHSLHAYFIRPGDVTLPIIYYVQRASDGQSFSTRQVKASQNGRTIFVMMVSFHSIETGWEHQIDMPQVPAPDTLPDRLDVLRSYLDSKPALPQRASSYYEQVASLPFPLSIKHVPTQEGGNLNWIEERLSGKKVSNSLTWLQAGPLGDDPRLHQCVAAYMSDIGLLGTSLMAHGKSWEKGHVTHLASLDHAMWFHHPFRADKPLLYHTFSPQSAHALGLNFGRFYNEEGKLVISTAQEGLIRPSDKRKKRESTSSPSPIFSRTTAQQGEGFTDKQEAAAVQSSLIQAKL